MKRKTIMTGRAFHYLLIACAAWVSACSTTPGPAGDTQYRMIDTAEARVQQKRGSVFIDLRPRSWYDEGHVPGAINLPYPNFNANSLDSAVGKEQAIVFYCFGIHCDYSNTASSKAVAWGYQEVYYYMKGYPAWLEAGYPVEP